MENTPANAGLIRDFEQLLRWQRWKDTHQLLLIAALLFIVFTAGIIANRYGLEFGWYFKWTVIEMGGKITLTPP